MTARQKLMKQTSYASAMAILSMVLPMAILCGVRLVYTAFPKSQPVLEAMADDLPPIVLGTFGVLFFFAGVYGSSHRCPWCDASLSAEVRDDSKFGQMKCCPHCGRSLDEELPAKGKPAKSKS